MTPGMLRWFGAETSCPEDDRPACVEAGSLLRLLQAGKLQLPKVRTRRGVFLRCLAVGLAIGLLGVLSAPARADDSGRLRLIQVLEDGKDGVEGLFGALSPTVSSDGANVYVTGQFGDALAVFARDAQSGRLTFIEAHRNGVNGVDGLGTPNKIEVSPDGIHVYVASYGGTAVTVFARAPSTGRLTFVQAQRDGLPGPDHRIYGLAVSPDGAHVYASGPAAQNDVAVFARDAVSGMLTPIEVVSTGLAGSAGLAVSPDGAHVYAAGFAAKAVTAFQREPTDRPAHAARLLARRGGQRAGSGRCRQHRAERRWRQRLRGRLL
ncbi:MAG TPA: beta-propeller fold lactonase family protein [Mycobacterium sp.]|nr:beta-propeller fold lactonase family protein [Mycobacterium sp.]